MASPLKLDHLPEHIQYLVCKEVYESSPKTVLSLLCVCKSLCTSAQPFLYRTLKLQYNDSVGFKDGIHGSKVVDNDPAGLIHSILSDASKEYALRAIRTLDIHVPGISLPPTEEQISARWQPLAALISHLTNLTHVQFKSSGGSSREPFPLLILQAIQTYHPAAKISMGYNWTRQGRRHLTEDGGKVTYPINSPTDPPELALCSSPNLDTLDLVISNSQAGEVVKAAYSRLIRLTPNLRNLTLREHIWGGCDSTMPEDDPWNPHGYGAFQTIKTAETWATGTPIRKEIRELRLEGVSLYEYTFDYWNEVLNFEKLELFEIKLGTLDACFFTAYGMPCLKTLNIDIGGFKHESQGPKRADFYGGLLDFLQNGPGLESLTLHGCDHPVFGKDSSGESSDQTSLSSVLSPRKWLPHQASTLKLLALHSPERYSMKEQRVVPALHLLEYIRDTCPSLKVLGIDENRTDDQENEKAIANVLCSFKQLDTIQLWPDLGVARYKKHYNSRRKRAFGADDEDSLKSEEEIKLFPDVDEEFVKRIWNYLQEKKEGKRLKKLLVKVGEWQGPIHGYPVRWVSWACSSKKSWILKQKERDDQVGECEISSTNHDYQEELYGES